MNDDEIKFTDEVQLQAKIILDKGYIPSIVLADEYGRFGLRDNYDYEAEGFNSHFGRNPIRTRKVTWSVINTIAGILDIIWLRGLPNDLLVLDTSILLCHHSQEVRLHSYQPISPSDGYILKKKFGGK